MTALIIIAAIAVLLFILLASSITAELEYDSVFKFKIKYLFFTLAKDPLSPKEQKKKKRKEEKKAKKAAKAEKVKKSDKKSVPKKTPDLTEKIPNNPEKKTEEASETPNPPKKDKEKNTQQKKSKGKEKNSKNKITPEIVFGVWGKAKPHVKRIFKKIRITGVYVDITVGGEDAAKTAVSYGTHCAAVNGLAAFLENSVTFKAEKINIRADFDLEKTVYYAKATVKLRLSTLLHSGLWGIAAVYGELKSITAESEALNGNTPQKAA